ncbi:diguanylate cyclase (GGDEF)-like protein [Vibrio sp. ES.051]|uniref:bifunctional diguanylate cyclase/phosphodiesterase n=1 Tax=Vibrio sp. ES.051 TaxID=1761909 RepID=UPI000BF58E4C|nr:EAL domain-containing protein [Vibrio sp. ES.051]PFG57859.1 diguanylate cyclase (GGDEF)-like protein [Vibrio sp. ES.051]
MVGVKKNIWTLYIALVTVSVVLFVLFSRYHYESTIDKYKDKQTLQVELFAATVKSLLSGQESLLEVVGHHLIERNSLTAQMPPMLDKMLSAHPEIIGLSLTNPAGDYIAVSSNLILEKLHNLKQYPLTRDTFLAALNSNRMVIGRTYFMPAQEALVIPIRKAIVNKDGLVQAVINANFNMNSSSVFTNDIHLNENNRVVLTRNDGYLTFSSSEDVTLNDYLKPVDDLDRQAVIDQINKDSGWDIAQLKKLTRALNVVVDNSRISKLITLRYLPDYQLWASSSTDLSYIKRGFYEQLALYSIAFLILQAAFYVLVRSIAHNEDKTKQRLLYQAHHDHLTGLPNRDYLRANIQHWLPGIGGPFSLMYIDVDNFKSVNDTYGHEFGDEVLKQVSARLSDFACEGRLIIRKASDEFIFLTDRIDKESVKTQAKQLIKALSEPYEVGDDQFLLSCSIGIACYPQHGESLDELLLSADIAMHQAKQQRNVYSLFDREMQATHVRKMRVEQRLRLALEEQTLYMVYQPQLCVNGEVYGVEALIRWQDDELGFVPPNEFIPVAESSGLMVRMGEKIIDNCLSDVAKLTANIDKPIQLSINISVKQFIHVEFITNFMAAIEQHGIDSSRVTLEITENLFIEDLEKFAPICERLHTLGFKIALDDFGTGYSSLSILRTLPIDEVKIDKSFVDHIEHDKKALNMIKNIISIGKNFEMKVLAEGVETHQQLKELKACGCDLIQGYFYSQPLSLEDLIAFTKQNQSKETTVE